MENSRSESAGSNFGERCMVASSCRSASRTVGSSCSPSHRQPVAASFPFEQVVAEVAAQPGERGAHRGLAHPDPLARRESGSGPRAARRARRSRLRSISVSSATSARVMTLSSRGRRQADGRFLGNFEKIGSKLRSGENHRDYLPSSWMTMGCQRRRRGGDGSQHVPRRDRPQPHGRAQGAARGGQRHQGGRQDRQEPARHVAPRWPGCAATTRTSCSSGSAGTTSSPRSPRRWSRRSSRRCSASSSPSTPAAGSTRPPAGTSFRHQRDRLRHHRARPSCCSPRGRELAPGIRLELRRDPRGHARIRARAAQLRRADRPARLRVPRLAGAAVPRPLRVRGRPGQPAAAGTAG